MGVIHFEHRIRGRGIGRIMHRVDECRIGHALVDTDFRRCRLLGGCVVRGVHFVVVVVYDRVAVL